MSSYDGNILKVIKLDIIQKRPKLGLDTDMKLTVRHSQSVIIIKTIFPISGCRVLPHISLPISGDLFPGAFWTEVHQCW